MGKIVLLAVAAAWAAVLLPPLLRSRMENRPGSSVTDFRRQLSTLQRAVPTRSMTPMRSMARPLAPSPLHRPAATGRPQQGQLQGYGQYGQFQRAQVAPSPDRYDRSDRSHGEPAYTGELQRRYDRSERTDRSDRLGREHGPSTRMPSSRRISQREIVRRRRTNVLFMLVAVTAFTLFLAWIYKSSTTVYAFAFAFVSLCGYCYKLAQLRQYEQDRSGHDTHWYHAA